MKRLLTLLMLIPALLLTVTQTVDDDGGANYTTIQDAISASADGDTVLVHPGTYQGVVDYTGKAISVMSLAITTGDTSYVSQTVIDGEWESGGVRIEGCDGAYLGGFSITRCVGQFCPLWYDFGGAGVFAWESVVTIENCCIFGNYAETWGGGIGIVDANCTLSGNSIYENTSLIGGGLLCVESSNASVSLQVQFDENHLNSIYCNMGALGSDMTFYVLVPDIYLDCFTAPEPDSFFVWTHDLSLNVFECNEVVVEPVEADLYVSAAGDDSNTGLTADDPLRTVSRAMMKIRSDSLNQRTVHVAEGYYSRSVTGELLPGRIRKDIHLIGGDNTVFDGDGLFPFFFHRETVGSMNGVDRLGEIIIDGFHFTNFAPKSFGSVIDFGGLKKVALRNIEITDVVQPPDTVDIATPLFSVLYCDTLSFTNVSTTHYRFNGIAINSFHEASFDCITAQECMIGVNLGLSHFTTPSHCTISNSLITGNDYTEPWPGGVIASGLVINGPYYETDPDSTVVDVINCTITGNTALDAAVKADDRVTANFYNTIIYGNDPNYITLDGRYNEGHAAFTNCLIENGEDDINAIGNFSYETAFLLTGDPAFLGSGDTPYELSGSSQCINAGTTDIPGYTFAPDAVDLAANPRIHAGQIDIGCYEYQGVSVGEEPESVETVITAYPNPVSLVGMQKGELCKIAFSMPQSGEVDVIVYNIRGQRVRLLASGYLGQGEHTMRWNGRDDNGDMVGSGVYLYRMTTEHEEHTGRLTIIK